MMKSNEKTFREEVCELLTDLETSLLELEEQPDDMESIGRAFRALHTIKGSGAMFGFDRLSAFAHELESVFDLLRGGKMPITKELIDLTLSARDQICRMMEGEGCSNEEAAAGKIVEALRLLAPSQAPNMSSGKSPRESPADTAGLSVAAMESAAGREATYRILFRPQPHVFVNGINPILLLNELRELGPCRAVAHTKDIPELDALDPEQCRTYWDIFLTTKRQINAIKDVFIFIEDDCELRIDFIDEMDGFDGESPQRKLGEILTERGCLSRAEFEKILLKQKRIGEMLLDAGLVDPVSVESALAEQQHMREIRNRHDREGDASSVRVPANRLDTLVDLVGELVTVQARLTQSATARDYSQILLIAEEVERLTWELRDNTMSIRMLPIGTTFSKFKRLVRDLSRELGKEVALTTEGAETELDKTVIERLNDPLVHLIRNSIDHGIEAPDVREAQGKPRQGTVHLSAIHSGANVLIRITDDGAGLDPEPICAKALEKGLIAPDATLSEKEIYSLILLPGFSTAREITSVSGRGVGMDVVKRGIDALRGSIEISSRKGNSTTITLRLPLTLAIIDGLLVMVGTGRYVLPLSSVEECVELTRADIARAHGRHITFVRNELVPYIRLREVFGRNGGVPDIEQIVVTEVGGTRIGFVVDKVVGEHQTVIKNLGKIYRNVQGISGATILGDGTVALILDVPRLVQQSELEENLSSMKIDSDGSRFSTNNGEKTDCSI